MAKPIYFQLGTFTDSIIEAIGLKNAGAQVLTGVREEIEKMAADQIMNAFEDTIGIKEAKMMDKLMEDHPEITEIDALLLIADDMPGLKSEIEKKLNSLYKVLAYN